MKIYSVSVGLYSSYSVVCLYTNKEDAELVVDRLNKIEKYPEYYVEKFSLDEHMGFLNENKNIYLVEMYENGDSDVRQSDDLDKIGEVIFLGSSPKTRMRIYVLAEDEKHAVKIANEKRVQLIAKNGWGKNE